MRQVPNQVKSDLIFNERLTDFSVDICTRAKRMRMYAKDENNMNTIIDTNMVKRIEEITVDLKKDGTVNSDSIFNKMEGLLEEAI